LTTLVEGIRRAYTYNTIINAYVKKGDFLAVEKILKVMKKENVPFNAATYTILIGLDFSIGKLVDAEKLFDEMRETGIELDIHVLYNLVRIAERGMSKERFCCLMN